MTPDQKLEYAKDWIIYGNGIGGWVAWNERLRKQKSLVSRGSFSEAVTQFEHLIGPYYKSRKI